MFKIGQKVICVDDSGLIEGAEIKLNKIYTIKDIDEREDRLALFFHGINNGAKTGYPYFWGYSSKRFRPIDDIWADDILSKIIEEVEINELVS